MHENLKDSSVQHQFVKRWLLFAAILIPAALCLGLMVSGPVQEKAYMGAQYCATCHQTEYESWAHSGHAQAFAHLSLQDQKNPACLQCHTTGATRPDEPFFAGVTCEACHGPGRYYTVPHQQKDQVLSKLLYKQESAEDTCRHCHSSSPNLWSQSKGLEGIKHWSSQVHPQKLHSP